ELDLAVAYVTVELDERARIEQLLEPLASEQLALRALALDVLLGRLVLALLAELREALQLGARAVLGRRHKGSLARSQEEGVRCQVESERVKRHARLDRSTAWPFVDGQVGEFFYSRDGHPVGADVERELGELDGGHALLFASGMAAAATALLGLLRANATVAIAEGGYYGTVGLARLLEAWGLRCVEFDQTGPPPAAADLVWLEAPSNPFLTFPDLEAAAAHPAPVVVDATVSTPVLLRPLAHGADVVLHSATKALGGHGDLLLGVLVCRSAETHAALEHSRTQLASVAA